MSDKVIDFNKSKQKLMKKMYPNVSPIIPTTKIPSFARTNKALEKFQEIFFKYEDSIINEGTVKKIDIQEVIVYFNRFIDEAYIELSESYDLKEVSKFKEALDYAMIDGGKRLRPFLLFATYYFSLGTDFLLITPLMVSLELIHTFSLIHDDLPCMDNDELRRNKPTVWKKYGEDIAVLAGDALLMEASTILLETIFEFAYTEYGSYFITSALILLRLAGLDGMITGQVYDVMNTGNSDLSLQNILYMYDKKTTALLTASLVIGANMSAKFSKNISYMEELGIYIGESYQIKDDLLEIESTTEKIGKSVDSDKNNNKVTYVSKVGIDASKERLEILYTSSMKLIDMMTDESNAKESKVYKKIIEYILLRVR